MFGTLAQISLGAAAGVYAEKNGYVDQVTNPLHATAQAHIHSGDSSELPLSAGPRAYVLLPEKCAFDTEIRSFFFWNYCTTPAGRCRVQGAVWRGGGAVRPARAPYSV